MQCNRERILHLRFVSTGIATIPTSTHMNVIHVVVVVVAVGSGSDSSSSAVVVVVIVVRVVVAIGPRMVVVLRVEARVVVSTANHRVTIGPGARRIGVATSTTARVAVVSLPRWRSIYVVVVVLVGCASCWWQW